MSSSPPEAPPAVQSVKPVSVGSKRSRSSMLNAAGFRQSILSDLVSQYGGGTLGV